MLDKNNVEQMARIMTFLNNMDHQVRLDLSDQFYKHVLDCIMGELLDGDIEKAERYAKMLEIPGFRPEKPKRKKRSTTNGV